jgi:hypothetical protein
MVLTFNTQNPIGVSLPLGGLLHDNGLPSLDVQFAEVHNPAALASAVHGLRLASDPPYIPTRETFMSLPQDTPYRILASPFNNTGAQNGPLPAEFAGFADGQAIIEYDFRDGNTVVKRLVAHEQLLIFRLLNQGNTVGGDSGAAVVWQRGNGLMTLVGMHIGGSGDVSFVIPSWMLFNPFNYDLPPGARLAPVMVP